MEHLNLSINPTYLCDFRCGFCYLTKKQLSDKKLLSLKKLENLLLEISNFRKIDHVDLYGGEIGLLPTKYLEGTISLISNYSSKKINVITNLNNLNPFFNRKDINLAVSWDYKCRQNQKKVLTNIASLNKNVHILMLASPQMLKWEESTIDEVIHLLNSTSNISTVEIKPYSSNQANQFLNTNTLFEKFIIKWIQRKSFFSFKFINEDLIKLSLNSQKSSWSDDHLYITPNGKFAVLDFDKNGHEYFHELEGHSEYLEWCMNEKNKVYKNEVCNSCKYLGHCLSEHLRDIKATEISCSGFKNLLTWYDQHSS